LRALAFGGALVAFAGCGGGGNQTTDAGAGGAPGTGGAIAGTGGDGTAAGGSGGSNADGGSVDGGGSELTRQLVAGPAHLLGTPTSACSQSTAGAAMADHWCAFTLPDAVLGNTDLWVVDVEKAAGAGPVKCDGSDASCLRLSTNLWTSQPDTGPAHPYSHHFYGQTLIFYTGAPSTTAFNGPIMAWRPGWPAARQISSDMAISCDGFPNADVALCFDNGALTVAPAHFDLRGGRLGAGALPVADTIYPVTTTGAMQWSVAFSPAGDYLAYSTGGTAATDKETLYAYKVDDVGSVDKRLTVGSGLSQWDIGLDGKHWYFMRNYNYPPDNSAIDPTGTLTVADFPGGGNETTLAPNVGSYVFLGADGVDRGVAFLDQITAGKGTYKVMADISKPATVVTVAPGVSDAVPSDDGRFTYVKTEVDAKSGLGNAILAKNDGSGTCTLAPGTTADFYGAPFLAHAALVFWADNINVNTGAVEGWRASTNGCADKQKFADLLDFWFPVGDMGLIYSDSATGNTSTLRFVKLGAGGQWPAAGPTTISTGVSTVYGLVEPDRQYVVYEIASGANAGSNGLWLYGPIGFGAP
jgi:hypothetical protein